MAALPAISRTNASTAGLAQSLQRLSTQPDLLAKERRDLPSHPRARLERLLQEIDEIILPRFLWVEAGNESIARIHVANRQIYSLQQCNSQGLADNNASNELETVATGIVAATKEMTSLRVASLSDDEKRSDASSGITLGALRSALGLTPPHNSIDQLARLLDPISVGRLESTAEAQNAFEGDHQWHEALKSFVKLFVEEVQQAGARSSFPYGRAIPLPENKLLIAACDAEQAICWVVDHTAGLKAISDWQALTPSNAF